MKAGSISRSLLFRPSTASFRRVLKLWKNEARAPLYASAYGWRDQGKGQWNYYSYSAAAISVLGVCRGLAWVQVKTESEDDKFILECDSLYSRSEFTKLKDFLEPKASSEDVEVLWRFARALHDTAEKVPGIDPKQKKEMLERAFQIAQKALGVRGGDECSPAHKWFGIILNRVSEMQGTKATIQASFLVREHWERAVALNPRDATSHSLLGEWCMSVASLSTISRSLASAIFASPPTATFDEALAHFVRAEEAEPGFWLKNQLNIAKCYAKLSSREAAKEWLGRVAAADAKSDEDKSVQKEAAVLLSQLK